MSEDDDFETRLAAVERDIQTLREDAATTRVMAAMAGRDSAVVAGLLKGLALGQEEHTERLDTVANRLGTMNERLNRHEDLLTEILRRLPGPGN